MFEYIYYCVLGKTMKKIILVSMVCMQFVLQASYSTPYISPGCDIKATISLCKAVKENDIKSAQEAIAQRADVNVKYDSPFPIVHYRAEKTGGMVQHPLGWISFNWPEKKVSVDMEGFLQTASFNSRAKVKVFKLCVFNVVTSEMTIREPSFLRVAVLNNALDMAELLIKHGADVNVQEIDGDTPLHVGVYHNALDMVELLIRHGAGVNVRDTTRRTPLYVAVLNNALDMVDLLIRNRADVQARDCHNIPLLYHALYYKNVGMTRLLVRSGAAVPDISLSADDVAFLDTVIKNINQERAEESKALLVFSALAAQKAQPNKNNMSCMLLKRLHLMSLLQLPLATDVIEQRNAAKSVKTL